MAAPVKSNKTTGPRKKTFPDLRLSTWLYIAVIALICIGFFHRVILGRMSFWEDLIEQEYPFRCFARYDLLHGHFPFWDPYTFGGMPFFAALQTSVLYPFNLLISYIDAPAGTFWYLIQMLDIGHFFIAGVCMFFLCREFRISRSSALLASAGYMLSGFFLGHVIHSYMLFIIAWLPLIMLLEKRGVQSGNVRWFLGAAVVLGLTTFAGHPQIIYDEFLFLGAYSIFLFIQYPTKRPLRYAWCLLMFAIAGGLGMVQLLPAAELSAYSPRSAWNFETASEGSVSFRQLITMLMPKIFGGLGMAPGEPTFWLKDSYHSGYWTFWETAFYSGIAVLLLGFSFLRKLRRNPLALFCGAWFLFSLVVGLGSHTPLYHVLFNYVPGFNGFRTPARIFFTWDLLLPFMAALTLDECGDRERFRKLFWGLMIACGAMVIIGLAVVSGAISLLWEDFANDAYLSFAKKQAGIFLLVVLLAALVLALYRFRAMGFRAFKASITAVALLDLFLFGFGIHQVSYSAPQVYGRDPRLVSFFQDELHKEPFRAKVREGGAMLLERNQGMVDRVQLLEGYAQLNPVRKLPPASAEKLLDLMNVKYYITLDYQRGSMGLAENASMLPRAKMFYKVHVIQDDSALVRYMRSEGFDHRNEIVLEKNPAPAVARDSPSVNTARVVRYEDNDIEVRVHTEKAGMLLLSEIWYPAWKAFLDGKPAELFRADYCLRAVEVPAGDHTVALAYRSDSFRKGLLLSLLTALLCAGIFIGSLARRGPPRIVDTGDDGAGR